jgi:hypothetical protein
MDEAFFNHIPHDAGHLVTIHVDNGIIYLDFSHFYLCKRVKPKFAPLYHSNVGN